LKQKLLYLVKIGLPLALLAYLLCSVDRADYETFWKSPKRWDMLLLAQVTALLAIVLSFLRWRLLVENLGIPFTVRESLRLGFLGYLLNFISLGSVGGDLFKAILVAKEKKSKRPEAVASVLLDRAIGLLGLIILAWLSIVVFADGKLHPLILNIGRAAGDRSADVKRLQRQLV
jgi:glycosyltransferase 2 family protein